jgi:uncharacterized membrane protein
MAESTFRSKALVLALALMFMVPVGMMFAAESAEAFTRFPGNYREQMDTVNFWFHDDYTMDFSRGTSLLPVDPTMYDPIEMVSIIDFVWDGDEDSSSIPDLLADDLKIMKYADGTSGKITVGVENIWSLIYIYDATASVYEISNGNQRLMLSGAVSSYEGDFLEIPLSIVSGNDTFKAGSTIEVEIIVPGPVPATFVFDDLMGLYESGLSLFCKYLATSTGTYDYKDNAKVVFDPLAEDDDNRTVNVKYYVTNAFGRDYTSAPSITISGPSGNLVALGAMSNAVVSSSTYLYEYNWIYPFDGASGEYAVSIYNMKSNGENAIASADSMKFKIGDYNYIFSAYANDINHYIIAGQWTSFMMRLVNTGATTDTYTFTASTPLSGWTVEKPANVKLKPGEWANVQFSVKSPSGATSNLHNIISVKARGIGGNVESQPIELTTIIDAASIYGVQLDTLTPEVQMRQNTTKDVEVCLRNLGTLIDSAKLEYTVRSDWKGENNETVNFAGWNVTLLPSTIEDIYGASRRMALLRVDSPADALIGQYIYVDIKATSLSQPTKTDTITVKMRIGGFYGFEVLDIVGGKTHYFGCKVGPLLGYVGGIPVGSVVGKTNVNYFTIFIHNTGDADTYSVSAWSVTRNAAWSLTLSKNTITLPAGCYGEIKVKTEFKYGATTKDAVSKYSIGIMSSKDPSKYITVFDLVTDATKPNGNSASTIYGLKLDPITIIDKSNSTIEITDYQKTVSPGVTATYKFRLTNIGNYEDVAYLSISLSEKAKKQGWAATIMDSKYKPIDKISLGKVASVSAGDGPGLDAEIILNVTAPLTAQVGEYLPITVTAVSAGDASKFEQISFVTRIGETHGTGIEVLPASQFVHPDEVAQYLVIVKNTGSSYDNYTLTSKIDSSTVPGWVQSLSKTTLSVPPGMTYSVILSVDAPSATLDGSNCKVNVTATCVQDATKKASAIATTTVKPLVSGVSVTVNPASDNVQPGNTVDYEITVSNTRTTGENDTINVTAAPIPEGWTIKFNSTNSDNVSAILGPGKSAKFTLSITAPADAIAGTKLLTILKAVSSLNAAVFDSENIITSVAGFVGVAVECEESAKTVEAGKIASYVLRVRNVGADWGTIALTRNTLPAGWSSTFSRDSLTLRAKEFKDVYFNITAPTSAADNTYILTNVVATSQTLRIVTDSILLNTTIVSRGVNAVAKYGTEAYVLPGGIASYVITVNNTGTTSDVLDISALLPTALKSAGWNASVDSSQVSLLAGATADVVLRVTAPLNATSGSSATISMKAASHSKPSATKSIATTTYLYNYISKDVDGDGNAEFAADKDRNATNGYEYFMEYPASLNTTHLVKTVDFNGDKSVEMLLGRTSGKPDTYWDPARNILTRIQYSVDMDNDSKPEYFIDTNGDGKVDILYDMENGTKKSVIYEDVDGNSKQDLVVDENGNGVADQGEQYYNTAADRANSVPEETIQNQLAGMLAKYWYVAVLALVVLILAGIVVGARKK